MGLKKNILYSGFLTTSLYIFHFITYPYVSRVLGVTNVGICNYVQSIVQYFTYISMLGITSLGVREIAKAKGDARRLHDTFSQLFTLNIGFTIFALTLYFVLIETLPALIPYRRLLYIGATQILFTAFAVEWLFTGIEDFKYITIRTTLVRSAYVISIFLFVKEQSDYTLYFLIYSLMIIATGVINWQYRRRFVRYSFQPLGTLKPYFKPLVFLGSQFILTSMYTTFNTMFLGMACGDTEVGYYTTATKIEQIILALYASVTLVIMPRISALIEEQKEEEIVRMLKKSFNLLFAFAFPCVIFSEFFAPEMVWLIAGPGFEGAILPMRIIMPLLLLIGIEQVLVIQILTPSRADRQVFTNAALGATCSVVLNFLVVPRMMSVGSAISWVICELVVFSSALYFVRKINREYTSFGDMLRHVVWFAPLCLLLWGCYWLDFVPWLSFGVGLVVTAGYTHVALRYGIRNKAYEDILGMVKKKLHLGGRGSAEG